MARQLRHRFAGGWYHITSGGMGRREIFSDDRDREHCMGLLAGMAERYGVILHAYALKENHYHLLIETPAGNARRTLHVGRMRCGLTLRELGGQVGGMGVQAAAKACGRMGEKLKSDKGVQRALARVRRALAEGKDS